MPLQIDWGNSVIQVTSPTVKVSGQVLHDFIEDKMASPEGLLYDDIIQPEGKIEDPSNPGIFSQIIVILNSPWQIQFWGGSVYTELYGAKIVGGLSDRPFKATGTAGDITILNSPVDGVTVAVGSGLDAGQDTTLTTILDLLEADEVHTATSILKKLKGTETALLSKAVTGSNLENTLTVVEP